jgi:TrkA domain protein
MIEITETELPGIGKKYTCECTKEGDKIVLLLHNSGKRDIYFFEKRSETPTKVITLTDEEARKMGAILEGAFFEPTPTEALELILPELIIEWVKVEPDMKIANRSIGEMEIRRRTGVSIIAILREPKNIPNPTPEVVLRPGDTLVVIGNREQFSNFQKLLL